MNNAGIFNKLYKEKWLRRKRYSVGYTKEECKETYQKNIYDPKKAPEYDNAYKTKEEVAKYLCKYYWSYTAEESFIRQVKRRNEIIHDEGRNLNAIWKDEKMQEYILKIAGIIDISEEIRKYNETKNTNFHELIYNLFCKYLENPNFIEEAINSNSEAKGMRTVKEFATEILNYRYGLNCY